MFPHNSFHPLPNTDLRWRPIVEERTPNCPRCDSPNTKFCYYNNYCFAQPRYLCKSCRRYWTKGGTLRNIPVGGACRKNRRRNPNKHNSTVPTSPPSPPTSFRPDEALETMSGGKVGIFPSPDLHSLDLAQLYTKFLSHTPEPLLQESLERQSRAEQNRIQKDELSEVHERRGVVDYNDSYLISLNNYELETDLLWEVRGFSG